MVSVHFAYETALPGHLPVCLSIEAIQFEYFLLLAV
jgi:hypothetical protein